MNAGDTFFVQQVGKLYDSHLWMVLSDPGLNANQVLIVSLTTWGKDDDSACVLNVGDHPFVRQKSFFGSAGVVRESRNHLLHGTDHCSLKISAKQPLSLQEFGIVGIPQPTTM